MKPLRHWLYCGLASVFLLPGIAFANNPNPPARPPLTLRVNIGTNLGLWDISINIMKFLAMTISIIAVPVFMAGAVCLVLGGARESLKETGKKLMIGSLLGLGVVLGSYAIVRTTYFFLYQQ